MPSVLAKNGKTLSSQNNRQKKSRWLGQQDLPESVTIMLTASIVGAGAGLVAVFFRWLISAVQILAYDKLGTLLAGIQPYHLLIIPALGGLIIGPLIYRYAKEAKGHGVPEVMEAAALHGGRIRPRVAIIKLLASAICIGTGGSVGRVGPIVQIEAALGSTIGQWLKLSEDQVRNLVACGAAGGIAVTFNAPIAGALFALEVILGQFHVTYFGAVVISAVTADVVASAFEGGIRVFTIPEYILVSPWELLFYVLLGILAAVLSVAFSRSLYFSKDVWDKLTFPEYFKPMLGGLVLGTIGLLTYKIDGFPRVFGVGSDSITEALFGGLTLRITLGLFILKFLATITTLGSGGSGGVFAPLLFMGAMLGAAFGQIIHLSYPEITAPPGAYALVGMSAFFSGAAHAPITAIIILFEMTGDYHIILPLMLTTVISTLVSRIISRESIYTLKLTRRGIHLEYGHDIDLMQAVSIGEVMSTDVDVVSLQMPLTELEEEFISTNHHGFPIVDDSYKLLGIISIQDLKRAAADGPICDKVVEDIATLSGVKIAYPDEPMGNALRRMAVRNIGRLPVVESSDSRLLVGMIRRSDIVRAYEYALIKRSRHQLKAETLRLEKLDDAGFIYVDIPPGASVIGKTVSEVSLPEESLIVSVRRGRKVYVTHGYTILREHDRLTVFAGLECTAEVRSILTDKPENS